MHNQHKTIKMKRIVFACGALLISVGTAVACSSPELDDVYDGPKDPCENEGSGFAADALYLHWDDRLTDGAYRLIVKSESEEHVCILTRTGTNEVGTPLFEVTCEDESFVDHLDPDEWGLSFIGWLPETLELTIERIDTGCRVTLSETPEYEARWSECGNTGIDAFIRVDIGAVFADDCSNGAGGAGGAGGLSP